MKIHVPFSVLILQGNFSLFFFFNIKRHFSCVDVSKNRLLFKIAILLKLVLLLLAKVVRLNAF